MVTRSSILGITVEDLGVAKTPEMQCVGSPVCGNVLTLINLAPAMGK
jgi:hypothetical protein